MDPNVRIPLMFFAIFVAMLFFSGLYPISVGLFIALLGIVLVLVARKMNYNFGKMWLLGIVITIIFVGAFVCLLAIGKRLPWLKAILLWPVG